MERRRRGAGGGKRRVGGVEVRMREGKEEERS